MWRCWPARLVASDHNHLRTIALREKNGLRGGESELKPVRAGTRSEWPAFIMIPRHGAHRRGALAHLDGPGGNVETCKHGPVMKWCVWRAGW